MDKSERIPEIHSPVMFNPHKHHLGFLKNKVKIWQKKEWPEVEKELRYIGANLIDLYYGPLSLAEVCRETLAFAEKKKITDAEKLEKWLYPMEFRKTKLSDQSLWVIKQGLDAKNFLHIHPAKHSPFTVRVRATTLKTVITIKILKGRTENTSPDLKTVNQIRTEKLKLSPVKALEKGKGISRLWALFS